MTAASIASHLTNRVFITALFFGLLSPAAAGEEIFTELIDSGVDFVQFNGASGEFNLPEVTCGGGALFDYDNDGDLDLYLVQGQMLGKPRRPDQALFPPAAGFSLVDRLFRNDLETLPDGRSLPRFTDVTEESGLWIESYGCGVAAGDYDNDGWIDIYLANLGPNRLFHNEGDGSFREVALRGGLEDGRWSVPATWFDFDRDGWLDLYVGNYLEFELDQQKICRTVTGARDYCNPAAYSGVPDRLFRNEGDGGFEDISSLAGISRPLSKSLGVVAADFNGDQLPDLYVTNDGIPNQLWIQQPGGRFVDEAMIAGCAVNAQGLAEASMGVDAADIEGDGDLDLFMTHLTGETNTLFVNDGQGLFVDRTVTTGLGPPSWRFTSWGLAWVDYDNDGMLDLSIANGAVRTIQELADLRDPYPFHQLNQLFHNRGNGRFLEVSSQAGTSYQRSEVSRALMAGDIDGDGDPDLVLVNNSGPARVLLNNVGLQQKWLGARLVGGPGRRDMIGGRGELVRGAGEHLWRRVSTDGSFASSNDPRLLFGLGNENQQLILRAHWPSGGSTEYRSPISNRYLTLEEPSRDKVP